MSDGILVQSGGVFSGGIVNAPGRQDHCRQRQRRLVENTSTFAGNISNAGTIVGGVDGVFVENVSVFSAGISNAGTLVAAGGAGIALRDVTVASGTIDNTGTINAVGGSFAAVVLEGLRLSPAMS